MTQTSYEAYVMYESICTILKNLKENKDIMVGRRIRHTHDIQGNANDAYEALALLRKSIEISRTVTVKMDKQGRIHITDERSPYQYSMFPDLESFIKWAKAEGYWRAKITDTNDYGTFYPGHDVTWPNWW